MKRSAIEAMGPDEDDIPPPPPLFYSETSTDPTIQNGTGIEATNEDNSSIKFDSDDEMAMLENYGRTTMPAIPVSANRGGLTPYVCDGCGASFPTGTKLGGHKRGTTCPKYGMGKVKAAPKPKKKSNDTNAVPPSQYPIISHI